MKKTFIFLVYLFISLNIKALNYNVTVPVGTKQCYIAGEMNGWSQQIMNKVDETHYSLNIASANITHKYKYCSGPFWSYVENISDNRSYSENDVVLSWAAIYDPNATVTDITYTVTVPEGTEECYFVGMATGWVHKQMARVDATHFKIIVSSVNKDSYKYCSGPDWAFEELDANGLTISNRLYQKSDVVMKWKQSYNSGPVGVTYNVTVPDATNSCFISGEMNGWNFTPMLKTDNTHFMVNIPDANKYQKYLYCSGPDISYKETKPDGSAVTMRTYGYNDIVEKWISSYSAGSSVTLTSDFSQKSYECGAVLPVSWTYTNVQNLKILFSGDYGLNWSEIAEVQAAAGQYNLTLPDYPQYQCKIKICDASNPLVNNTTKGMFVVYNHLPEKVNPLLRNYFQVFLYPYNDKYPLTTASDNENINGKVGNACGPTAVTNILSYWEFPRKGFGSKSFTDIKNCSWSADFAAANYNFDLMSDQLTPGSASNTIDANATLMYHAAVAMHDIYRSGNSTGVLNAFKQYFGYNSKAVELCRDHYLPEQWEKIMKSELSLGRPQIIQGWGNYFEDGNYGGHWFICDGYSADNLFHISLDYGANGIKYCPLYEFDFYSLRNWIFAYLEPDLKGRKIELTYPTGKESWQQNTIKNIQWKSNNVSFLNIEFSGNNGATWSTIATNVSAGAGNYDFSVNQNISDFCKIRLTASDDVNIYAKNRIPFSIYEMSGLNNAKSADTFSIYPNPASEKCTIHLAENQTQATQYLITDMHGQCIANGFFDESNRIELNLSAFPKGLYLIQITNNYINQTGKIVIK